MQALAVRVFGATTLVWGDGPDGGREATFEGVFHNPATRESVNGYLVVQAKFLQRPHASSRAQSDWAIKQLRDELSKYTSSRRIPDAYIFATNAILTPPSGGGKDELISRLEKFRDRFGLHFAIPWDYDQLGALLDDAEDIRVRYSHLITPGDVLHSILRQLRSTHPSLEHIIPSVLQKEFISDASTRLLDPTLARDIPRYIAEIFADLPAKINSVPSNLDPSRSETFHALDKFLSLAADPVHTVLLGGPGQGKTTLVQMLAQLHRAALLRAFDRSVLSPLVEAELTRIGYGLERLGLRFPTMARFPLWIDAASFAMYLRNAAEDEQSIWHFLAGRYRELVKATVSSDALRTLVQRQASILILDGYDEISLPERTSVLQRIVEFGDETRISRADAAIVVTSRPQAYENELHPHGFSGWILSSLSVRDAKRHAVQLTRSMGDDRGVRERFERAASYGDVRSLLHSPLHVALIVSLLSEAGDLPRERYRLFARYYNHVYERERDRGAELGLFLERYRGLIDELHKRLAFAIHLASEESRSGRGVHIEKFVELAESTVGELGVIGADQPVDVVEQLIHYARERLVLIVGLDTNIVGFQIKPLAEFLAAAHLNGADDERLVRERFRAIAPLDQWRDVTRFVAASAFEPESLVQRDLRDSVVVTLRELDSPAFSGTEALRLRGASLAVDVLADTNLDPTDPYAEHLWPTVDVASDLQPFVLERLGISAQRMPDPQWLERLTDEIEARLSSGRHERTLWKLLNLLAEQGNLPARAAARDLVSQASASQLTYMLPYISVPTVISYQELPNYLRRADPHSVAISARSEAPAGIPAWAATAWQLLHGSTADRRLRTLELKGVGSSWPLSEAVSMSDVGWLAPLTEMPVPCHPGWQDWSRVARLLMDLSASTLDDIAQLTSRFEGSAGQQILPWPVRERLKTGQAEGVVEPQAWRAAEERWVNLGVALSDVEAYLERGALSRDVARAGFPFATLHWIMPGSRDSQVSGLIRDVWDLWGSTRSRFRSVVANYLLLPMCDYDTRYRLGIFDGEKVQDIVRAAVKVRGDDRVTCGTAALVLSTELSDDDFAYLASALLEWSWLLDDDEEVSAAAVLERGARLLSLEDFRELCVRYAERTSDGSTWDALLTHWIRPADRGMPDWPLLNLLGAEDPTLLRLRDMRLAARTTGLWRLLTIIDNVPYWPSGDREHLRNRLLIEFGDPWMAHSSLMSGRWPKKAVSLSPYLHRLGLD